MKTKGGSCNPGARRIRLNTELAKKPRECLEYIVVHEMAHVLEPTHNARFVALMNQCMPQWQFYRDQLNRLPISHTDWAYCPNDCEAGYSCAGMFRETGTCRRARLRPAPCRAELQPLMQRPTAADRQDQALVPASAAHPGGHTIADQRHHRRLDTIRV